MHLAAILVALTLIACGSPNGNREKTVIGPPTAPPESVRTPVTTIPETAVTGNFDPTAAAFYAYVGAVDHENAVTTIQFQQDKYESITVPKTYGGQLKLLQLPGQGQDMLLFKAKLKDPNFHKYFPYVMRNGQWKPLSNGFAIHKSNMPDTISEVIRVNPENPTEIIRYYSVFDLDASSTKGYTWRLLTESIPKENE
ncbi:MAG: hypothetical protein CMC08_03135 [Flavobacteriaceae bacterium]|nr:hypothetical protein [Flavobacteriaceae bacterium]